jgi:hypothetical protein
MAHNMTKAAQSVFVFGVYMAGTGSILLLFPNMLLSVFGLPQTSEVWIRVVGLTVLVLAYYYIQAARNEVTQFFRWTVHIRIIQLLGFIGFVAFGLIEPAILLFSLFEFAFGIWTWSILRKK